MRKQLTRINLIERSPSAFPPSSLPVSSISSNNTNSRILYETVDSDDEFTGSEIIATQSYPFTALKYKVPIQMSPTSDTTIGKSGEELLLTNQLAANSTLTSSKLTTVNIMRPCGGVSIPSSGRATVSEPVGVLGILADTEDAVVRKNSYLMRFLEAAAPLTVDLYNLPSQCNIVIRYYP